MTTIPTWLRQHLEATGLWNTDGVSRTARPTSCRKCGAIVMRGLDDRVAGLVATADPTPITPLGEALAQLDGRWTYRLSWRAGHYELDDRDEWAIQARPAGTVEVLAQHRCHSPPLPACPSVLTQPRRARESNDMSDPPF